MKDTASPCSIDAFLEALSETDRSALRPMTERLGLRYAFPTRWPGEAGGLEASLLSACHLVPVRHLAGGRLDVRIVPLALVLSVALREEAEGLELQLDLYESSPIVLRWSGEKLATVVEDKAFQLLMNTCGFTNDRPERAGRLGFRGPG
jgi:hypothetical protein